MTDTERSSFPILRAMLKQEESCYRIQDYFQNLPSEDFTEVVDAGARQQIAQWCTNIMEACNFAKEHAAVTMSCLDRFVSSLDGSKVLLDRSQFQLAALTSLYISVKIHCPQALPPDLVAKLSRGMHKVKDIEAMERRMLDAIQWRVNPPTAMDFVRIYLDMIASKSNNDFDQHTQDVIIELTGYQASLSVIQFDIAIEKASHIAVASLMNALECIYTDDQDFCDSIYHFISRYTDVNPNSIKEIQEQLYKSIIEHTSTELGTRKKPSNSFTLSKISHRNAFTESPRSVM